MKIITVLKNDSAEEILELFRQAPGGEVIFVLPKKCKAFSTPAHFAAIASEASSSGKTVSIMAADAVTAQHAQAHGLAVVSAGKPTRQAKATLATQPPPADDDIQDFSEDAFQDDVVLPQDETMGIKGQDDVDDPTSPAAGMHEEEQGGTPLDEDADGIPDRFELGNTEETDEDASFVTAGVQAAHAALAASSSRQASSETLDGLLRTTRTRVQVPSPQGKASRVPVRSGAGEGDYIDTVWRDRTRTKSAESAPMILPPTRTRQHRFHFGIGHFSRGMVIGLFVVALLALGAVLYTVTGAASATLTPISSPIDLELTVQASDVFGAVDAEFLKLPGQRFSVSKSSTATESATGSRDVASKARGTITVTNEYSSSPQTLIATTRFADSAGHIYRTLQSITVPGSRVVDGKTVAGTIEVGVIADKPGAEYNIPAGSFVVQAFQEKGDTERVEKLYGVSQNPMSGGANGPSAVVTQENYDAALASAQEGVRQSITDALNTNAPGMRVLAEQEITWEPPTVSARPDDAAAEVSVTAHGTLQTIAFRQQDLDALAQDAAMQQRHVVMVPEQVTYSFSNVSYDPDTGILTFTLHLQGPGYAPIDPEKIQTDILGKKSGEIRAYFSQNEDIQSAILELSPPWLQSVPDNPEKVHISINYEQ